MVNLEGYLFEQLHTMVQSKGFVLTKGQAPPVTFSDGQQQQASATAGSSQLKGPAGTVNDNNLRQELAANMKQSFSASSAGSQQQGQHVIGGRLRAWAQRRTGSFMTAA
jgi:hypothetical protein